MHRRFLLLALVGLGGCDAFSDPDVDLMVDLDGVWALSVTTERIASDGTVAPATPPLGFYSTPPGTFEVGRRVECNRIELENVSERDRVAVAYDDPEGPRPCKVLTADGDADRIVFVGDGPASTDVVGTIRERSASRHVWEFYAPQLDRSTLRFRWTLTR